MAWAGRVLCVKLWGSFNLEGVQSLIKGLLSQVETPPARWATCYDLEEWEGVTPDAVELFLVALGNALQIGWSAHAVVARSAAKVHLFSLQIERFMQGIHHILPGPLALTGCWGHKEPGLRRL